MIIYRTDEVLVKHQYKMCLHGQPSYLVPYELVTLPEGYHYIYDEDVYKSLWSDMDTIMSADRLKKLLSAMAGVIDDVRDYLLGIGQVQFNEESVLEDENGGICFIYRPFEVKSPVEARSIMSTWLSILNRHVDPNCEKSMAVLHTLGIALVADVFDLMKFRDLVRTTIGEQV